MSWCFPNNYNGSLDSNVPPVFQGTNQPLTNIFGVSFHALLLDASALETVLPVYVYDLILHAKDITVSDTMTVLESLFIDGKSFTLNGDISVPGFSHRSIPSPAQPSRQRRWPTGYSPMRRHSSISPTTAC